MYKNNFDCSSTGINIEVDACYDTCFAHSIYQETYETLWNRRGTRTLCIRRYDFDDSTPDKLCDVGVFKTGKHGPMPKQVMCDILNEYSDYSYDTQSFTTKELYDELRNLDIKYLPQIMESNEFQHYYHLDKNYALYGSSGYCQGDFAYVLCRAETLKNYRNLTDHELWDCPISACISIAGVRYEYGDFVDDQYDWCKGEFIKKVVDKYTADTEVKEFLSRQLNDMLPEELDYV